MSDIFYNNLFFKWITPDTSGSERGGDKPVNYQNKTFSQPAVFKKNRRRSESQPSFFGDDSRVAETGDFDIFIATTKQKRIHTLNKMIGIWVM